MHAGAMKVGDDDARQAPSREIRIRQDNDIAAIEAVGPRAAPSVGAGYGDGRKASTVRGDRIGLAFDDQHPFADDALGRWVQRAAAAGGGDQLGAAPARARVVAQHRDQFVAPVPDRDHYAPAVRAQRECSHRTGGPAAFAAQTRQELAVVCERRRVLREFARDGNRSRGVSVAPVTA
jgi:hypothetical protein